MLLLWVTDRVYVNRQHTRLRKRQAVFARHVVEHPLGLLDVTTAPVVTELGLVDPARLVPSLPIQSGKGGPQAPRNGRVIVAAKKRGEGRKGQ